MGKERTPFFKSLPPVLGYEPVEYISIGKRKVGKGHPTLIIAEVGANHRGDIKNAFRAIDAAANAGADAVKFQHLTGKEIAADTIIYDDWNGKSIGPLSGFYKGAELPYEWTSKLVAYAKKRRIQFLSTPFDVEAVDVLAKAGVDAYKFASYELTDDVLLRYVAKQGKPIILSTGMAYLEEVAHAVRVAQVAGNNQLAILHCVSMYPPKSYADLNLRAITTLQEAFKLPVGYSDHSVPPLHTAAVAAVTLGACIIEKHITDTRTGGSNDDLNSLEPAEFARMVKEIRAAEEALSGSGIKQPVSHKGHKGDEIFDRFARRSVYAARDIAEGEVLREDMIITLRPWGGMAPQDLHLFLGKRLRRAHKARSALTPESFFE